MTADLIARADRLKVIGRAGTGVDNVDMDAATKRGIIVANAPESNSIAAAEHTLALALALCRNVPQAHSSLVAGEWARSRYGGNELYGKTLGVVGFGRIGQLVAKRAQAFDMDVVAFDKFVTPERFRELGVEGAETISELYGRADLITLHVPKTPETEGMIDDEAIAQMREGTRLVNCARGPLVDLDAVQRGLESGRLAGVALDVFPEEPFTEHPLFERDDVVLTPHLGASTAEAQDRAGVDTAGQVRAALTGGVVTNAVNIAAVRPEAMEALAPFVPLCEKLGRLAQGLGSGAVDRVEVAFHGRIAEHDTRLLGIAVLVGILSGHTEEPVNLVNAPAMAEDRGIELTERKESASEDFTELVTVRIGDVDVAGTGVGPRNVPYLVGVWGQSFYMPFADHLAIFRYADQPGMIGRVGTAFGEHGREHRLGRRRRRGERRRRGGDGADHRRARARRGDRRDRRRRRLLRSAAPSRSGRSPGRPEPRAWVGLHRQPGGIERRVAAPEPHHSDDLAVSNGPKRGIRPLDLDPTRASAPSGGRDRNDLFARIDELVAMVLDLVPRLIPLSEEALQALMASVDTPCRETRERSSRHIPLDLWVVEVEDGCGVTPSYRVVETAHDLNVCQRHSLQVSLVGAAKETQLQTGPSRRSRSATRSPKLITAIAAGSTSIVFEGRRSITPIPQSVASTPTPRSGRVARRCAIAFHASPHQSPLPASAGSGLADAALGGSQSWTMTTPPTARCSRACSTSRSVCWKPWSPSTKTTSKHSAAGSAAKYASLVARTIRPRSSVFGCASHFQRGIRGRGSTATLRMARTCRKTTPVLTPISR